MFGGRCIVARDNYCILLAIQSTDNNGHMRMNLPPTHPTFRKRCACNECMTENKHMTNIVSCATEKRTHLGKKNSKPFAATERGLQSMLSQNNIHISRTAKTEMINLGSSRASQLNGHWPQSSRFFLADFGAKRVEMHCHFGILTVSSQDCRRIKGVFFQFFCSLESLSAGTARSNATTNR